MKQNRKPNRGSGFQPHVAKTPDERASYDEKVKFADSEGETAIRPPAKTSTLSGRSVYARSSNAGIPDREPIKPPQEKESWHSPKMYAAVVAIAVPLVGAIAWLTTLHNRICFNENTVTQLSTSLHELDLKREEIGTRVARLEQWKDTFSEDLKRLKQDMNNGHSDRDVEAKLSELEKRILMQKDSKQE